MPGSFSYDHENLGPLISAWAARYVAKGCSEEKARRVASERVRHKRTWPA